MYDEEMKYFYSWWIYWRIYNHKIWK
jgi:hypothetical protein